MRGVVTEETAPPPTTVTTDDDHCAVIVTGAGDDVAAQFRFAGVVRTTHRFKDNRVLVRFGSAQAARRALDATLPGLTVVPSKSRRQHNDDEEDDVEDDNRLYPHEIPEVYRDFKKRRLLMPRDHLLPA